MKEASGFILDIFPLHIKINSGERCEGTLCTTRLGWRSRTKRERGKKVGKEKRNPRKYLRFD